MSYFKMFSRAVEQYSEKYIKNYDFLYKKKKYLQKSAYVQKQKSLKVSVNGYLGTVTFQQLGYPANNNSKTSQHFQEVPFLVSGSAVLMLKSIKNWFILLK